MTTTDTFVPPFTPMPTAHAAYQAFRPKAAGAVPLAASMGAATKILYTRLSPAQVALVRYYGTRLQMLADLEPKPGVHEKPWDAAHRELAHDTHRETLRCLMVALLVPHRIRIDSIASGDFAGLAAIALANLYHRKPAE